MPVMYRDRQEVEVMYSGFVADADADISVCGRHMRRHVKRDRESPELPQNLHDSLNIYLTDETIIEADNPLIARYNYTKDKHLFCIDNHMFHLMERQSSSQILCNQLKMFGVADDYGIPTDITSICCIL